jgi:putative ABC transport system permease protein
MRLPAIFAAAALAMAAVGIDGVMSYSVQQRARQNGDSHGLGASRANVLQLVLGQSLSLTTSNWKR